MPAMRRSHMMHALALQIRSGICWRSWLSWWSCAWCSGTRFSLLLQLYLGVFDNRIGCRFLVKRVMARTLQQGMGSTLIA